MRELAILQPELPQPPRRMQQVQMQEPRKRGPHALERVTSFEQRQVKRLAVEGDDRLIGRERFSDRCEHRLLLRIIPKEELPDHKPRAFRGADSDQESASARPARQARRLRIEIDEFGRPRQRRLLQKQVERPEVCRREVADPQLPVGSPEGKGLPRPEKLAPVVRQDLSLHVGLNPARHALCRQRPRPLLQPPQVFKLALELAVAAAFACCLLQLTEFFF